MAENRFDRGPAPRNKSYHALFHGYNGFAKASEFTAGEFALRNLSKMATLFFWIYILFSSTAS